mmetsp:Transcript_71287/g.133348  ORF Transcript_71287/g.133348 Transcript_71287/m.133348 type:complete len:100 (-) Transcript_71287:9-308(-)
MIPYESSDGTPHGHCGSQDCHAAWYLDVDTSCMRARWSRSSKDIATLLWQRLMQDMASNSVRRFAKVECSHSSASPKCAHAYTLVYVFAYLHVASTNRE